MGTKYPKVHLYRMGSKMYKHTLEIDHTDSRFIDRSLPLGYINYNSNAYYVSRIPYRHFNQAIKQTSLMSNCGNLNIYDTGWFFREPMYNLLKGIYPSVRTARNKLEDGSAQGVAVHRDLALKYMDRRTIGLYYKDRLAAIWDNAAERWDYRGGPDAMVLQKLIGKTGLF
jgi:hypothetical protein